MNMNMNMNMNMKLAVHYQDVGKTTHNVSRAYYDGAIHIDNNYWRNAYLRRALDEQQQSARFYAYARHIMGIEPRDMI